MEFAGHVVVDGIVGNGGRRDWIGVGGEEHLGNLIVFVGIGGYVEIAADKGGNAGAGGLADGIQKTFELAFADAAAFFVADAEVIGLDVGVVDPYFLVAGQADAGNTKTFAGEAIGAAAFFKGFNGDVEGEARKNRQAASGEGFGDTAGGLGIGPELGEAGLALHLEDGLLHAGEEIFLDADDIVMAKGLSDFGHKQALGPEGLGFQKAFEALGGAEDIVGGDFN